VVRAAAAAALLALALAAAAHAATPTGPVYDERGRLVQAPFAPAPPKPNLTEEQAIAAFFGVPKVAHWLQRYPKSSLVKQATYDSTYHDWDVKVWSGKAGEIAAGRIDDLNGVATEALTGPQVAWGMARGGPGAFGGEKINSLTVWLAFCAAFLIGLGDWRRPFSLRNLDLLALLSFSVSLWYFNRGDIFTSVPLVYPPMIYLLGRMLWSAGRGRLRTGAVPVWPVWALAAAAVFAGGFRIGLNLQSSNVIDRRARRGRSGRSGCWPRRPSSSRGSRSASTSVTRT
jgi:hypothetical protein